MVFESHILSVDIHLQGVSAVGSRRVIDRLAGISQCIIRKDGILTVLIVATTIRNLSTVIGNPVSILHLHASQWARTIYVPHPRISLHCLYFISYLKDFPLFFFGKAKATCQLASALSSLCQALGTEAAKEVVAREIPRR